MHERVARRAARPRRARAGDAEVARAHEEELEEVERDVPREEREHGAGVGAADLDEPQARVEPGPAVVEDAEAAERAALALAPEEGLEGRRAPQRRLGRGVLEVRLVEPRLRREGSLRAHG